MFKEPIEYIKHILDECSYLESTVQNKMSKEDFLQNETLKRASVRSLEIIGEATKKLPSEFKEIWHLIEWRNMAGMRDRLIHDYMGTNYLIVWDVIKNKIPELHVQLKTIVEDQR